MSPTFISIVVILACLVALKEYVGNRAREAQAKRVKPISGRPATADDVRAMLAPFADALEATRRPVARIRLESMPEDQLDVSKIGGRAYWPQGEPPPVDERGMPLALLAQVAFDELPQPLFGWPASGLLQIFIASDATYGCTYSAEPEGGRLGRSHRIVYWSATPTSYVPLQLAASKHLPHDPSKPRRMRFDVSSEVMSIADHRFDRLLGRERDAIEDEYANSNGVDSMSLLDALCEHGPRSQGHRLGGYPDFTQEDPRGESSWELLLQLDTDDEMMWGDSGVANFFIEPAKLARADFHRVLYTWDCC